MGSGEIWLGTAPLSACMYLHKEDATPISSETEMMVIAFVSVRRHLIGQVNKMEEIETKCLYEFESTWVYRVSRPMTAISRLL